MSKIVLLILLLLSLKVAATNQYGDILIMGGDTLALFSNPLHSRPDWKELSVVIRNELENEDKRLYPQKYEAEEVGVLWSTACNRGYVAEWKILNDSLFLSNIFACDDFNVKISLQKLFKGCKNGLLFADWVTQELIVPKGECILSVNLGYHSVYETEIALDINNGLLTDQKSFSNHIVWESQFSKNTDPFVLNEFIQEHINWNNLPELENKQIHVSVAVQPDDAGRLASIINEDTYIYGNDVITDPENPFIKEAIRITKHIPDWDVVYQRGKIRSSGITVVFDDKLKEKYTKGNSQFYFLADSNKEPMFPELIRKSFGLSQDYDFQLRFWIHGGISVPSQVTLYVMSYGNGGWDSQYFRFISVGKSIYHLDIEKRIENTEKLWDSLMKYEILDQPDMQILKKDFNYVNNNGETVTVKVTDGQSYTFEFLKAGKYRRIDYHCPASYAKYYTHIPQLQTITQCIKLIYERIGKKGPC